MKGERKTVLSHTE